LWQAAHFFAVFSPLSALAEASSTPMGWASGAASAAAPPSPPAAASTR
jgi:hypothetical protein